MRLEFSERDINTSVYFIHWYSWDLFPTEYAYGFVVICFVVDSSWCLMGFIYPPQFVGVTKIYLVENITLNKIDI